jgi:hypothetical protein
MQLYIKNVAQRYGTCLYLGRRIYGIVLFMENALKEKASVKS